MQLNPNEYGKIPEIEAHIAHLLTLTESLMDARMRRKFDAQDIVQETMISAYNSFDRMTAPADVGLVRKWL